MMEQQLQPAAATSLARPPAPFSFPSTLVPSSLSPMLYHLADAANWASIQRYGLLSTSALLDLARIEGNERERIERQHRAERVTLATGTVIRDQQPMPPAALARCLRGMTPAEWYALLNAHVFFWLASDRLNRMLKANYPRPQVVLVLETAPLLAAYADRIALTPINTGNARRQPAVRGRQTFVPYQIWRESRWASEAGALGGRERPKSHRPAELVVRQGVPDIMSFVRYVRWLQPGESFT